MTKLIVAFRNFENAPKIDENGLLGMLNMSNGWRKINKERSFSCLLLPRQRAVSFVTRVQKEHSSSILELLCPLDSW